MIYLNYQSRHHPRFFNVFQHAESNFLKMILILSLTVQIPYCIKSIKFLIDLLVFINFLFPLCISLTFPECDMLLCNNIYIYIYINQIFCHFPSNYHENFTPRSLFLNESLFFSSSNP